MEPKLDGVAEGSTAGGTLSWLLEGWHLTSLDAPTVAAVWTWFVARCAGISLPVKDLAAMFLAVWLLYAADRLLDARALAAGRVEGLEARHLFHHRHRRRFGWGLVAASALLAGLLPALGWTELRLYVVLAALLAGWFAAIHARVQPAAQALPKEFAVGIFFAAAVCIPTLARAPWLLRNLLLPAALFGALCSLNCLFLFTWECSGRKLQPAHRSTRFAAARVEWLTAALAVAAACTGIANPGGTRWLCGSVALSACALQVLHLARARAGHTRLRTLADAVLLTPLVLAPWMR